MRESRKREIRIKAENFRGKCKVGRYGILDLFKECERCGYKLIRYPLGENADMGFSMEKDGDTIIFTNTCYAFCKENFTLAHEIGHVVLHSCDQVPFIENTGTAMDEKEEEADYFAVSLLMPGEEVGKFLDLEIEDFNDKGLSAMDLARLMSEFHVSFDLALARLESLQYISHKDRLKLDNERMRFRVEKFLQSMGGAYSLNEAGKEVSIPYEYIRYAVYNYNRKAIPKETLEKLLNCYHLTMEDISDRLEEVPQEEEGLDELIGGLED